MKIKFARFRFLAAVIVLAGGLGAAYDTVGAQDLSGIDITLDIDCGTVEFNLTINDGIPPYQVIVDYGDDDPIDIIEITQNTYSLKHIYQDQGDFTWNIKVLETSGEVAVGTVSQILTLAGPEVTLNSDPFPPLLVVGGDNEVQFTAEILGGELPLTYTWDLGVEETLIEEGKVSGTFREVGKYYPQVLVTDNCGFTSSDTIPVVVADPENACHPTAQKIADGVNTIFPDQAGDLYTCDDIYSIFENESDENNIGFGRMWQAYRLAQQLEELNWEDILDWHLNEGGWGALLQLDRFSDLLEEHDLPELLGLVISQEYNLGDVRTAVRTVTRYEADFDDALSRILAGATPGELGQLYKLAADLEADLEVLDGYLADGMTLAELKHTSKLADQMEADWTEIADARLLVESWGDINQAYRLATDDVSPTMILSMGVQEYKEFLREEQKTAKAGEDQKAAQAAEKIQQTAEKLAEQFSAEFSDVMRLLNSECMGEWACVRSTLRDQEREMSEGPSEKDHQTAQQIALKYGFSKEDVLAYHQDSCGENWTCTRAYFREQSRSSEEKGNSKK